VAEWLAAFQEGLSSMELSLFSASHFFSCLLKVLYTFEDVLDMLARILILVYAWLLLFDEFKR
jgi:hypothetical protein